MIVTEKVFAGILLRMFFDPPYVELLLVGFVSAGINVF
jgi:hypothetical protein